MAGADQVWTVDADADDAPTYLLEVRAEPYLVRVDGKFVKVKVVGAGNPQPPQLPPVLPRAIIVDAGAERRGRR